MRTASLVVILVLAACTALYSQKKEQGYSAAEQEIRKLERGWSDARVSGDVSVFERIMADDFIATS